MGPSCASVVMALSSRAAEAASDAALPEDPALVSTADAKRCMYCGCCSVSQICAAGLARGLWGCIGAERLEKRYTTNCTNTHTNGTTYVRVRNCYTGRACPHVLVADTQQLQWRLRSWRRQRRLRSLANGAPLWTGWFLRLWCLSESAAIDLPEGLAAVSARAVSRPGSQRSRQPARARRLSAPARSDRDVSGVQGGGGAPG
jgi:hypothetical protein